MEPGLGERGSDVDRRRRLAYTTLLVRHRHDPRPRRARERRRLVRGGAGGAPGCGAACGSAQRAGGGGARARSRRGGGNQAVGDNGDEGDTHHEGNAVFLLPDHDAEGHEDKCDGQVLTIGPEGNFVFEVRYVLCAHSASGV